MYMYWSTSACVNVPVGTVLLTCTQLSAVGVESCMMC